MTNTEAQKIFNSLVKEGAEEIVDLIVNESNDYFQQHKSTIKQDIMRDGIYSMLPVRRYISQLDIPGKWKILGKGEHEKKR